MSKPSKAKQKVADHFIGVLRAYKAGRVIQLKQRFGLYADEWHDFDLWTVMNPKDCKRYRVKP